MADDATARASGITPPPVPPASTGRAVPSPPAIAAMPNPPPVPPLTPSPVPPPVPPAVPEPMVHDVPFVDSTVRDGGRRVPPRAQSEGVGMAVGVSAVVLAAAAAVSYVAWPHLSRALDSSGRRTVATRPDSGPAPMPQPTKPAPPPEPRPEPTLSPQPEPVVGDSPARKTEPTPRPAPPPKPRAVSAPAPAPVPESAAAPQPPPIDIDAIRTRVNAAVTKAFAAIRDRDFDAAKRDLQSVADLALDDQQATDRLQQWRQLLAYAEAYPGYRDRALESAAATAATYDFGSMQIAAVELNAREFIYRDSRRPGRNLRAPRDAIPPDVEQRLVEAWFSKDGRAANHLFLGAAALARREPDLGVARREWEAAAAGGEADGRLLLGLLDDPAVRGR